MKITFLRQYRKQSGKIVFVYTVSGTVEQLAEYKAIKGANFREDEATKLPLFFSQRFAGIKSDIVKNKEGKDWNVDTTELDQLASLSAQYGIDVATAMMKKPIEVAE